MILKFNGKNAPVGFYKKQCLDLSLFVHMIKIVFFCLMLIDRPM